jgi:EAL domain-containing protein (putative c-di-GMP-specific phosphodiesterase class I)
MFTWNLQFVSKKRLEDTLYQFMVSDGEDKDVLVRIHTAIHTAEEAVDLAAFIKRIIPNAKILGTSTSAIISEGKLIHDQCVISITQMDEGKVLAARIPLKEKDSDHLLPAEELCARAAELIVRDDTKLLFVFSPVQYRDIERFVECSNTQMPGVRMIGGVVDWNDIIGDSGFVFDETGWSGQEMILAAMSGDTLECLADFATGVQVVGETHEITETRGDHILGIDGKPAAAFLHDGIGEEICTQTEIGFYFPLAYCFDGVDVPFVYGYYGEDGIGANHNVTVGRKIRRGFFYDRKIVSDNRSMFDRMESFEKGESFFSYGCKDRFRIYPNSVVWELSAYENSNISGCLTQGEISLIGGRNAFTNCAFVLAAAGENPETQQMNPYVFSHTENLAEDNQKLIGFLMDAIQASSQNTDAAMKESMESFVDSCRQMLLYTEKEKIANQAALHMDVRMGGYDRVCVIDVPGQRSMRTVFSEERIEKTHSHFVSECTSFAARKNYHAYLLKKWQMAIAVPSYMVSLEEFSKDMRDLQKLLFETKDDYIPIVSIFCIVNECTADNLKNNYDAARLEMLQKNNQFYVCDGKEEELDAESIREKYRMVNVINYALAHDGVVPYYQGIYDNREQTIHHYEALMRLKDEDGKIYTPFDFLDVARSYGLLYDALSLEMIRKVFDAFKDSEDKSVSINLGMRDIKNEELTGYIYSFLSTVRHPEHFIFEILENEDVDEYETLLRFVNSIHKLGGKTSIDDFGSGYSNLLHVVSIPADFLKIDGSIIKECCNNKASEVLVQLISTWKTMNERDARIVAEFVENEAIQDKLLRYQIDYSQGYLFSKPVPEIPGHGEKQKRKEE